MDWKKWIMLTGIGIGALAIAYGVIKTSTPKPSEMANQITVRYTGHLDLAFHSVCEDATGKIVPCTAAATKASLTEAITWYYVAGAGHGLKYYDWNHITFNPAAHCGTGDIVEKWVNGVDQHKCACLLTGVTLQCHQGTPKPVTPQPI